MRFIINIGDADIFVFSIIIYSGSIQAIIKFLRDFSKCFLFPLPLESGEAEARHTLPKMTS